MKNRQGIEGSKLLIGVLIGLAVVVAGVALVRLDTIGEKGSGLGKEFTYDIKDLAKVDPALILYEEAAQEINTGFSDSRAIVVDSQGSIYVAGDKGVTVFDKGGNPLDKIELGGEPRALTVTDDGRLYIGMKDHIEIYDSRGKRLASWEGLGNGAFLTSIDVSGEDVFVADAGNRIVLHYDTAGKLINRIGLKDEDRNVPGFMVPSPYFDLAVDRNGLLRVVNPGRLRIEAYTFDGDFEFSWGKASVGIEGFCGCCNPVNFAILPSGGFVTCEKGLVRVKVYDSDGGFVGVVASPGQLVRVGELEICETPQECQSGGFDVAVDTEGKVYVLDSIKNVIRIFSRKVTE
jgi:hypothetical protein